jgi:hypothetical protein
VRLVVVGRRAQKTLPRESLASDKGSSKQQR